jgi:hypothetical protein
VKAAFDSTKLSLIIIIRGDGIGFRKPAWFGALQIFQKIARPSALERKLSVGSGFKTREGSNPASGQIQ